MVEREHPARRGLTPDMARKRIESFARRFGQAHLRFAQHAAFPLALTPDLAYRLWANFQRDTRGEKLAIPWIAVADLLLSGLCEEVGHELYEMPIAIRETLLSDLQTQPALGPERLRELSHFLLKQIERQLASPDPDMRDLARAQQWMALAYTHPDDAARELRQALLLSLEQQDTPEQLRLASLIETFTQPLASAGFVPLLTYARGVERLAHGDLVSARAYFSQIAPAETSSEVPGMSLPVPLAIQESDKPTTSPVEEMPSEETTEESIKEIIRSNIEKSFKIIELFTEKLAALNEQLLVTQDFANAFLQLSRKRREVVAQKIDFLFHNPRHPSLHTTRLHMAGEHIWKCVIDRKTRLLYETEQGILRLWYLGSHEIIERVDRLSFLPTIHFFPFKECLTTQPATAGLQEVSLHQTTKQFPPHVFCSYAPQDYTWLKVLKMCLQPLIQEGLIERWADVDMRAGKSWRSEINRHLNTAGIILLLVSANFLASEFCQREMLRAMERHQAGEAIVIPVLLRPVDWRDAPFGSLQPTPTNGIPVALWPDQDEALEQVAYDIRKVVQMLARQSVSHASTRTPLFWSVPFARNTLFVGHEDLLQRLHIYFHPPLSVDLLQSHLAVITGRPGTGKTQLALEYAYRYRNKYRSVFWVSAELREILDHSYSSLAEELDLLEDRRPKQHVINETVKQWLATHSGWLLIFDGADNLELVKEYLPSTYSGHLLLTSRGYGLDSFVSEYGRNSFVKGVEILTLEEARAKVITLLCYVQEDERLVNQFKAHFSVMRRLGYVDILDYGGISSGEVQEQEVRHLNEAQIILLFISADFLASDYCYTVEMQQAIERHGRGEVRIIPIILRPVYLDASPFNNIQILPHQGKPITTWVDQDRAFVNIVTEIKVIIQQWDIHSLPSPVSVESEILVTELNQLVETIKAQMQPESRALAAANSLQQLRAYIPFEVTLADLARGWQTLSHPAQTEEEPAIAQRRVICGELAHLASQFAEGQGNLTQAIKTWQSWQTAFEESDDPRRAAMAKTFARELIELEEALKKSE